jgi:hypothetical protein
MSVQNYNELSEHFGHPIEIAMYGVDTNLAIECVPCSEVLLDFDNEDTTTPTITIDFNDASFLSIVLDKWINENEITPTEHMNELLKKLQGEELC